MNNYVTKLNLPIDVEFDFEKYLVYNKAQNAADKLVAPSNLVELLTKHGMIIDWLEVFVLRPGQNHPIHTDGPEIDNKAKFNYIVGGAGSKMRWYDSTLENCRVHVTSTGNTCMLAKNPATIKTLYEEEIRGFVVAKVGILHDVTNPNEMRFCLSLALHDAVTDARLSYEEVVDRLSDYIIV